jgi:uncharacterized membrane protein
MAVRHLLGAATVGVAAMFFLDPSHGRRRRAVVRDRVASGVSGASEASSVAMRDLRNRTRGLIHEVRSRFNGEEVPDEVLRERVRSRLGWAVSHPGAIEVQAVGSRVILSGAVLEREYIRLLRTVWAVRGVADVEDRLAVYESGNGVSSLQGAGRQPGPRFAALQEHWSPAVRVVLGATGVTLLMRAIAGERKASDLLTGTLGTALLIRSATNMPLSRVVGVRKPAVDVQKIIDIAAPVEQVFGTFAHFENFPQFMRNIREVRVRGDGTSEWVVNGPMRRTITWDALTTRLEPNRLISWRTLPGSPVEHAGFVRFEPTADNGTRVLVTMSYTPPAGALGHAVARLFGSDPKSELDDDLLRLKVYLETGRPPHDAAARQHSHAWHNQVRARH